MESTTIIDKRAEVLEALAKYIAFMNEANIKHTAERFPSLKPEMYWIDGGRKYLRIAAGGSGRGAHVHCFVDAETGDVYKSAGWKAPALNGARYNLLDAESYEDLQRRWDPYGRYLYKR